jgi:hypothetical protein
MLVALCCARVHGQDKAGKQNQAPKAFDVSRDGIDRGKLETVEYALRPWQIVCKRRWLWSERRRNPPERQPSTRAMPSPWRRARLTSSGRARE